LKGTNFEDTKRVIRRYTLKDRKYNGKKKEHKRRNNDRQNINLLKSGVNSGASERLSVPAPHVTPVVLLLNDTDIILYENRVGHQINKYKTP